MGLQKNLQVGSSPHSASSSANQTAVSFEYSPDFPGILQHLKASLAVTTYQAGKLAVIGVQDDVLQFSFHPLEQAMGVAVGRDVMALGSRRDIHLLRASHDIAPGIHPAGAFDAAWLTRHSFRTGNIHGHEFGWGPDGLWIVNTRFSCLCTLDEKFSFVPRWRPPFISQLEPSDRCHLNGLAMHEGVPKFVTAHGDANEPGGWRESKATGGVVIDVESGATVCRGFAMPHSPRLSHGRLWVLNSGAGQLGTIDVETGRFEPVAVFPGYARGLAFHGQFAFVGLSKIRETSTFGGMPLEEHRSELRCGLGVVDLTTGRTVATLQFHSGVDELFAVSVLPDCLRPCVVGPHCIEQDRADIWIVPNEAAGEGQDTSLPQAPDEADFNRPERQVERLVGQAGDLERQGRFAEAIQAFDRAIALAPDRASLHCNQGNLWQQQTDGRQQEAIQCYERALECDPQCLPARQSLGYLLSNHGRTDEAVAHYNAVLESDPSPLNRLLLASVLPVIYDSVEEIETWRSRMIRQLDAMIADGVTVDTTRQQVPTGFYTAYQGQNDVEVMRRVNQVCAGEERVPRAAGPLKPRSDGRLRIGFLSAWFHDHTIGRLNLGRIRHLDRSRFEVTVISTSRGQDQVAADIRQAADRFAMLPPNPVEAHRVVCDQDLDVLIFADVGMDALTTTLSRSRLAPVQCATWGHPETTGSPYIDFFLSSELLEVPEADDHYVEKLIRLPLLATWFERPRLRVDPPSAAGAGDAAVVTEPITLDQRRSLRAGLGVDAERHLYACPQSLFKLHPEFDDILAGILKSDPAAEIVLVAGHVDHWATTLRRRFERTLPEAGARVRILPRLSRDDFLRLLAAADVILDPTHFGGGHTSYEALAMGSPIVTLPGEFLRSRITQALYRRMQCMELVVADAETCVQAAVRLATDEADRTRVSRRILEACPVLFENPKEVACLEDWLWSLTE
jgi:protein O-GlcNAc transferase